MIKEVSTNTELYYKTNGIPITTEYMSNRLYNCLKREGYSYLSEIINLEPDDLYRIKNVGKQSVEEFATLKKFIVSSDREAIEAHCAQQIGEVVSVTGLLNIISYVNNEIIEDDLFVCVDENGKRGKDYPIFIHELSARAYHAVRRAGITSIRELANYDVRKFSEIKGLGKKTFDEIIDFVKERTELCSTQLTTDMYEQDIIDAANSISKFVEDNLSIHLNDAQMNELCKRVFSNHLQNNTLNIVDKNTVNDYLLETPIINVLENEIISKVGETPLDSITIMSLKEYLPVIDNYDGKLIEKIVDIMIAKQSILKKDDCLFGYKLCLYEWVESLDGNQKTAVELRLNGKTLEEIGIVMGITRERVRQIVAKAIRKKPILFEDGYSTIYEKYSFENNEFESLFNVDEFTVNYLKLIYRKGFGDIYSFISDDDVPEKYKERVSDTFKDKFIIVDDEGIIPLKRERLVERVLKEFYSETECTIAEFGETYYEFLRKYNLETNEALLFNSDHALEAYISDAPFCVLKLGKTIRFYDTQLINVDELLNQINISAYMNLEISTLKLVIENPDYMEMLGIRDEYELHNILRKNPSSMKKYEIEIGRMPNISIGKANREKQVRELLYQLAPISNYDLALEYELRYGVRKETVLANYLKDIDIYLHNGIFVLDQKEMDSDEFDRLSECLTDDFYLLDEVYKIYSKISSNPEEDALNSMTLKQLGFKVYSQCVIRNTYPTADAFFRTLLCGDVIDIDSFKPGIKSNNSFYNRLNILRDNLDLIEIDKNKFVSFEYFIQNYYSCEKEDIINIGRRLSFLYDEDVYSVLTYDVDEKINPMCKVINSVYFLNSAVRIMPNIKTSIIADACVIAKNGKEPTLSTLMKCCLLNKGSLHYSEIIDLVHEKFGILLEKHKVPYCLLNEKDVEVDTIRGTARLIAENDTDKKTPDKYSNIKKLIKDKRSIIERSNDTVEDVFKSTNDLICEKCLQNNLVYMKDLVDKDFDLLFDDLDLSILDRDCMTKLLEKWARELNTHTKDAEGILNLFFK